MTLAQRLARPLLASSVIASGVKNLRAPQQAAKSLEPALNQAEEMNPSVASYTKNPELVAQVLGGIQVGSGALLALGKMPRFAAVLLGASQAVNAAVEFFAAPADSEEAKEARTTQLLKNASILGGVIYASVDRGGKPSLMWRTQQAAKDAQKQVSKAIDNVKK